MEAAALYSFATVNGYPVVCFAYVTNQIGQGEEEFEKGDANGSIAALEVIEETATAWQQS